MGTDGHTDDIVKRLRWAAHADYVGPPPRRGWRVMGEAADEIERLRAEVAQERRHRNPGATSGR